jgi:hypothetical protein
MRITLTAAALIVTLTTTLLAQPYTTKPLPHDKFRQLEELLPTPNDQRTASGAPGRAPHLRGSFISLVRSVRFFVVMVKP